MVPHFLSPPSTSTTEDSWLSVMSCSDKQYPITDLTERTGNVSPKQDQGHHCSFMATDKVTWGCWAASTSQLKPAPAWFYILHSSSKILQQKTLPNNKSSSQKAPDPQNTAFTQHGPEKVQNTCELDSKWRGPKWEVKLLLSQCCTRVINQ